MPLYLRKSVRVGPLRFNLSKSGVGVSTGIKGFRVGAGPRGNYIYMGRNGVYYRMTLPNGRRSQPRKNTTHEIEEPSKVNDEYAMVEIDSSDISNMQDSSAASLLQEINHKRRLLELFPLALTVSICALLYAFLNSQTLALQVLLILSIIFCTWARFQDALRKTVVLLYEFDEHQEKRYQRFCDGFDRFRQSRKIWHIGAAGKVRDMKRNAGADVNVSRSEIRPQFAQPPYLRVNVDVPCIPVGTQKLYFFPDTVLIYEGANVGAISYDEIELEYSTTRFIESESVPSDSKVIDRTWRYVNKKGGPDKRFKDNPEIPVVAYGELYFTSDSGLNECVQVSNPSIANGFATELDQFSQTLQDDARDSLIDRHPDYEESDFGIESDSNSKEATPSANTAIVFSTFVVAIGLTLLFNNWVTDSRTVPIPPHELSTNTDSSPTSDLMPNHESIMDDSQPETEIEAEDSLTVETPVDRESSLASINEEQVAMTAPNRRNRAWSVGVPPEVSNSILKIIDASGDGDNTRVSSLLEEIVEKVNPPNIGKAPSIDIERGMTFLERREFPEATDFFVESLNTNSSNPVLWRNLALAQLSLGETDSAKNNLYQSISLAASDPQSWNFLGLVFAKEHDQHKAVSCFRIAYLISDSSTIEYLKSLDKDESVGVRLAAAAALKSIQEQDSGF